MREIGRRLTGQGEDALVEMAKAIKKEHWVQWIRPNRLTPDKFLPFQKDFEQNGPGVETFVVALLPSGSMVRIELRDAGSDMRNIENYTGDWRELPPREFLNYIGNAETVIGDLLQPRGLQQDGQASIGWHNGNERMAERKSTPRVVQLGTLCTKRLLALFLCLNLRYNYFVAGADIIASMRKNREGDIPLSTVEVRGETKRFSPEVRKALEKEGHLIYTLTGQSIKSLREVGRKFSSTWHKDYPDFEALTSRLSEVAINPNQLFLPDSNWKTLPEQEAIVAEFFHRLNQNVKEVEAIIGEAPDYVELAFVHLDATGEYLFGKKYNFDYARTKTRTGGPRVAYVGFCPDSGLLVSRWHRDFGYGHVWAAPLVVPA